MIDHSNPDSLTSLISKLSDSRVLVIGDIVLDRFVYGSVDRISPESPVPVLNLSHEDEMLGASGNTLSNLAGLGVKADIISVIGKDDIGVRVKECVQALGYECTHLIEDEKRPSIIKTRYLAGHQQLLRTDFEKTHAISDEISDAIMAKVQTHIDNAGCVILSDYGKGVLRADLIQSIITYARGKKVPVIVDPKGRDFSKYNGANAITPNKKELSEATEHAELEHDEDIIHAGRKIIKKCKIDCVFATRSGDGISVIEDGEDAIHIAGADIDVFDVSGAGDTVIATIASVLAAGGTYVQAAQLANIAGSLVVTKVGTAPIRINELKAALEHDTHHFVTNANRDRKKTDRARRGAILNVDEAAEQVRRWKARGLKVGFTNGCFDILHYGHVTYLNDARDHCDRLIMGLNTDISISLLKGPERPVHDEQSRATVLAALGSIDSVVFFGAKEKGGDNTACNLLDALKPDIYFKGGDYTVDQIPEAPTVLKNGGEVKIMPVYDGHSTTNSIEKIKAGEP